jgi:hypothetical protein
MKALLVIALTLLVSIVVVVFLPLPVVATQALVTMLGGNACLSIAFALMANGIDK